MPAARTRRFSGTAAALVCFGSAGPIALAPQGAAAQQADSGERDRIVVTARRREETLIEAPAAVTAFMAEDIESAGITSARDYIALTPNVTLVETQNAGTAFVTIRGISQARKSEPSVAVVIDGVQQTNPSAFTQELVDIQQIEVLRGPQGAIYGRNAIGGAIIITSRGPTEDWEGAVKAGIDNGFGYDVVARASGPVADRLGFAGGISWRDTDGYLENEYLHERADPLEDLAGRGRLVLDAGGGLTIDLRGTFDQLHGRSLYYVIGPDVNDTSIPIRVNNRGVNDRDIYGASLQLQYEGETGGTFTSTTAWDSLEEILTGDQFDFKPIDESFFFVTPPAFGGRGSDFNQSQFLDVDTWSQELRYVSPSDRRWRYVAGVYGVKTDRFISTGNMFDTGNGVFPVRETPSTNPLNPQDTFLADGQDNLAWAVFGDLTTDLTDEIELSLAARYDRDHREQTTLTPPQFLRLLPNARSGEVRDETFDALLLLRVPLDQLHAEPGQHRRGGAAGLRHRGDGAAHARADAQCRRGRHRQRDHAVRRPRRDRQQGAARLGLHAQLRRPVARAARRERPRPARARGPPAHRRYLLGALQHHGARPGGPGRPADRRRGRNLGAHGVESEHLNEKYNAEFSPGGFLWKGQPLRYGLELTQRF